MKNLSIAFVAALSLLSVAGCKKKADGGAAEAMGKMVEFKDKMCGCADKKDKDCAQKVTDDMTKWAQDSAKTMDKNAKPTEADMKKMEEVGKQLGECTTKAMMADMAAPPMDGSAATPTEGSAAGSAMVDGSGSAVAPTMAAAGDLPAECADYKSAMEKYAACDKVPAETKDAMKKSFEASSAAWANIGAMPADAKAQMASGCKQGVDALKQGASALGCSI